MSQSFRSLTLLFVILNALFLAGKKWLSAKGVDYEVLLIGNVIVFAVVLLSFILTQRSFKSANPNSFVRAIYAGFIIKFFIIAIAAFVYIMVTRKNVNKPALFGCMGLYVLYTVFEVSSLLRLLKRKNNG